MTGARRWLLPVLGALFLAPIPPAAAQPTAASVPGELLVRFRAPGDGPASTSVRQRLGSMEWQSWLTGVELYRVDPADLPGLLEELAADPGVEYAEPNHLWYPHELVPDDPYFDELWGLRNTGQSGGTPGADIGATLAWELRTGAPAVRVGVIDTGVDYTHPDLAPNIWINPGEIAGNGIDDDNNGFVDDVRGWDFFAGDNDPMDGESHGTHVAGTIGAVGDNGLGVAGVAWRVEIVPIRFLGPGGGTTEDAIRSVEYSVLVGCRITNNSWGGGPASVALRAAIEAAGEAGQVFVTSAGNSSVNIDFYPTYPASYPSTNLLSVASSTRSDGLSWFTNYGQLSVDIFAPGSDILSCIPGASYGYEDGTSMASPHVSGALALVAASRVGHTPEELIAHLLAEAEPLPQLEGRCVSGGRLDIAGAVAPPDSIPPATTTDLVAGNPGSDFVTLGWTAAGDDSSSGVAAYFDLRWRLGGLDDTTWDAANRVDGTPTPPAAGDSVRFELSGLPPGEAVAIGLRSFDEVGLGSGLSNVVQLTTLGPPALELDPAAVVDSLGAGGAALHPLVATNTGEGNLDLELLRVTLEPLPGSLAGATEPSLELTALPERYRKIRDGISPVPPRRATAPSRPAPSTTGWPPADAFWLDELEGDLSGWSHGPVEGTRDAWAPGGPARSGQVAWVLAAADAAGSEQLVLPRLPLQELEEASLLFWHRFHFDDCGDPDLEPDGGRIEVRVVGEDEWELLVPEGGYPYQLDASCNNPLADGRGVWAHDSGGEWWPVRADLGPWVGHEVELRFLAGFDCGNCDSSGEWAIDDLAVTSAMPRWLEVTPPSLRVWPAQPGSLLARIDATDLLDGSYRASIELATNVPGSTLVDIPVALEVGAGPALLWPVEDLAFGEVALGFPREARVALRNAGNRDLQLLSANVEGDAAFEILELPASVPPRASGGPVIRFDPADEASYAATLHLTTNDPDHPAFTVELSGRGLRAAELELRPTAIADSLPLGFVDSLPVELANGGGMPLEWTASILQASRPGAGFAGHLPLPGVAEQLDGLHAELTALLEDPFEFSGGEAGSSSILDGGNDMYDGGNYLHTGLGGPLPYTGGVVTSDPATLGEDGSYFTAKHPALFVFAGDLDGAASFRIEGNLGWDGFGVVDTDEFVVEAGPHRFRVYFKRVHGPSYNPSVNHLVMVEDGPGLAREANPSTNSDYHRVVGLPSRARVYYVLFAETAGGLVDVATATQLATRFLVAVAPPLGWIDLPMGSGTVPAGAVGVLPLAIDLSTVQPGSLQATLQFTSSAPASPQVELPILLRVGGAPRIVAEGGPVDLGATIVGDTAHGSMRLRNTGTELLLVDPLPPADPAFTVPPAQLSVAPGDTAWLELAYSPAAAGPDSTLLQLRSNSPGDSLLGVLLRGEGLPAPLLSLEPDSLHFQLSSRQLGIDSLVLRNDGEGPLHWRLQVEPAPGPASRVAELPSLEGARVLVEQAHAASSYPGGWAIVLGELRDRGAIVDMSHADPITAGDLEGYDLLWVGDLATGFSPAERAVLVDFLLLGGSWLLEGDDALSVAEFGLLLDEAGVPIEPSTQPGSTGVTELVAEHPATEGVGRVYLTGPGASLAGTSGSATPLVLDRSTRPSAAAWSSGISRVLIACDEYFNDSATSNSIPDNLQFAHSAIRWLTGKGWLSYQPRSGTLEAGADPVTVRVEAAAAGLEDGRHEVALLLSTDDPLSPQTRVPVTLDFEAQPRIRVEPDSIAIEGIPAGTSVVVPVVLSNAGDDTLRVQAANFFAGEVFQAGPLPAPIGPGDSAGLELTLLAPTAGAYVDTLRIHSNDSLRPVAALPLRAGILAPPSLVLSPAAVEDSLGAGATLLRELELQNAGGAPLHWSLDPPGGAAARALQGLAAAHPRVLAELPAWQDFPGGDEGTSISSPPWGDYGNLLQLGDGHPGLAYTAGEVDSTTVPGSRYATLKRPAMFAFVGEPLGAIDNFHITGAIGGWERGVLEEFQRVIDVGETSVQLMTRAHTGEGAPSLYRFAFLVGPGDGEVRATSFYMNGENIRMYSVADHPLVATVALVLPAATKLPPERRSAVEEILAGALVHGGQWVRPSPSRGVLPAGESTTIELLLDSGGLLAGWHEQELELRSDDPEDPLVVLPARLRVQAPELVVADPAGLDLGIVGPGGEARVSFLVRNLTAASVVVEGPPGLAEGLELQPGFPATIAPGGSSWQELRWTPAAPGQLETKLELPLAGGSAAALSVPVAGEAAGWPVLTLEPDTLFVRHRSGDPPPSMALRLANGGVDDASARLAILPGPAELPGGAGVSVLYIRRFSGQQQFYYQNRVLGELANGGAEFREHNTLSGSLDPGELVGIDLLWSGAGSSYQSASWALPELYVMREWVAAGGLLFLDGLGDIPNAQVLEALVRGARVEHQLTSPMPTEITTGAHPVLPAGMEVADFDSHAWSMRQLPPEALVLAEDAYGGAAVMAVPIGEGMVIATSSELGSSNNVWDYLDNKLALRRLVAWGVGRGEEWISAPGPLAPLAGGAADSLRLQSQLSVGEPALFQAEVVVTHHGPGFAAARATIHYQLEGNPSLAAIPDSIDFGGVLAGGSASHMVRVTNTGNGVAFLDSASVSGDGFVASPIPTSLDPGDFFVTPVRFAPPEPTAYAGTWELWHGGEVVLQVGLDGHGLRSSTIALADSSVSVALPAGRRLRVPLAFSNAGEDTLVVRAAASQEFPADPVYMWSRSGEPGGPAFDWREIRGSGTLVPGTGSTVTATNRGPFSTGFAFPLYSSRAGLWRVCSNGWISPGSSSTTGENRPLPDPGGDLPTEMVAPMWAPLDARTDRGMRVYWQAFPDAAVVQWVDARPLGDPGAAPSTFQVLLRPDGTITFQYLEAGDLFGVGTVGIMGDSRSAGLTVSHADPAAGADSLAIRIQPALDWMTLAEGPRRLAPGEADTVWLELHAPERSGGAPLQASVELYTNDPDRELISVPVRLEFAELSPLASLRYVPDRIVPGGGSDPFVARLELPAPHGVAGLDSASVRLAGEIAPAWLEAAGDPDGDGEADVALGFPRSAVEASLNEDGPQELPLSFLHVGTGWLGATAEVEVILPWVLSPNGGEQLLAGQEHELRWAAPPLPGVRHSRLEWAESPDGPWRVVAAGLPAAGRYPWTVPARPVPEAWLRICWLDGYGQVVASDRSDRPFGIVGPAPSRFRLLPPVPNPFNPQVELSFELPADCARARLVVMDLAGRTVAILQDGPRAAGRHSVRWAGRDQGDRPVASGVYLYRLEACGSQAVRRMLLLK